MIPRRAIHGAILLQLSLGSMAQVVIDKPVVLTGSGDDQRQVTGLPHVTTPGALLTAGMEQSGAHRYAVALPGASWSVDLPGLEQAPAPGTAIVVAAPPGAREALFSNSLNNYGPPIASNINAERAQNR